MLGLLHEHVILVGTTGSHHLPLPVLPQVGHRGARWPPAAHSFSYFLMGLVAQQVPRGERERETGAWSLLNISLFEMA